MSLCIDDVKDQVREIFAEYSKLRKIFVQNPNPENGQNLRAFGQKHFEDLYILLSDIVDNGGKQ